MSSLDLFGDATGSPGVTALNASLWASWPNPSDLAPGWRSMWSAWAASATAHQLDVRMREALAAGGLVYPPQPWRALTLLDVHEVRVVILGQDPYHGPGQANGLAFSVHESQPIPPSLRNIRLECQRTESFTCPPHGDLTTWARRGVLLLNTSWTVEDGKPASHAKWGWDALTNCVLRQVLGQPGPLVVLAWGGHAQQVMVSLSDSWQARAAPSLQLQSNHPSPLSARRGPTPFVGNGHFEQARIWLQGQGINWRWDF
jgi:uracil-DNA glycosylase